MFTGLAMGVSVWKVPFEWTLDGVCTKSWEEPSLRIKGVGVQAGPWWMCSGGPGRGVDVLSTKSLDLTL